ncbi:PilZ domain-containing protein [uncultured Roseovarius sp.]|uniref:PilZ domain-containing protein n=1 Tax=uncultured Roseovarius sp. TaxID=293344 RepID=UPI0026275F02|nr:PilZ domain-containing protein [uncultured Roseovarius sp.]
MIETLAGLPMSLASLRANGGNTTAFQMDLRRSLGYLNDRRRTVIFTRSELRTMRIFAGAVREDWKMNGSSSNGRQIPGLTKTSTTIQTQLSAIASKFGCEIPSNGSVSTLWNVKSAPINPLTLLIAVLFSALAVLSIYRLVRQRYQSKRRICNVRAMLHHGDLCVETTILDISRGGAMVESPTEEFPTSDLTLQLTDHDIVSRVVWTNSNFIGLSFDKMLSSRVVDEIAEMSHETDQVNDLTDATTDRFEVGQADTDPGQTAPMQLKGMREA